MKSKYKGAYFHCKERAMERYGIDLSEEAHKSLGEKIKKNGVEVEYIMRLTLKRDLYKVNFMDVDLYCVYDKVDSKVVTFLKKSMTGDNIRSVKKAKKNSKKERKMNGNRKRKGTLMKNMRHKKRKSGKFSNEEFVDDAA